MEKLLEDFHYFGDSPQDITGETMGKATGETTWDPPQEATLGDHTRNLGIPKDYWVHVSE